MKLSETQLLDPRSIARWGPLNITLPPKKTAPKAKLIEEKSKVEGKSKGDAKLKVEKTNLKKNKSNKSTSRQRPISSMEKKQKIDSKEVLETNLEGKKIGQKQSENISGKGINQAGSPIAKKGVTSTSGRNVQQSKSVPDPEIQKKKLKKYLRRIRKKIDARKKYPYAARRFGLRENVYVRFQIGTNGKPTHIRFPRPAHKLLKKACTDAIHAAAPFQKPPLSLGAKFDVEIVMAFKLE